MVRDSFSQLRIVVLKYPQKHTGKANVDGISGSSINAVFPAKDVLYSISSSADETSTFGVIGVSHDA